MCPLGSGQMTRRQAADYGGEVDWELAQINVARMRSSLDTPEMAAFVAAIDPVLRMAEESDGFVWRYADGHGRTVTVRADGVDTMVVTCRSGLRMRRCTHSPTAAPMGPSSGSETTGSSRPRNHRLPCGGSLQERAPPRTRLYGV
jgi:hypothetical protein